MTTHDYTKEKRYWGHDYIFDPINGGMQAKMTGWGNGLKKGDFLILSNDSGTTRYKITTIEYFDDPRDMWTAEVVFAPRPEPQPV